MAEDQQDGVSPELGEKPNGRGAQEDGFPRALGVRLFVYLAGGHLFGAFLWLLFELGGSG